MNNHESLSKSAQRVQAALLGKGLSFTVKQLNDSTRTANDAAAAIGCAVDQIVKSLLFCTKQSKTPILILASGKNRVDQKMIEALVGEAIIKADPEFTREITGFAIGGIPPLGNDKIRTIYIDQDLLQFETVWAAAGTPFAVFSMPASQLKTLTDGEIVAIT